MPFNAKSQHRVELHTDNHANQAAPFLISSAGRYLWSDRPFTYEFRAGVIALTGSVHPVGLAEGFGDLPGAFRAAQAAHFPPSGQLLPAEFFEAPQYNTWIDLNHNQNQEAVLAYARGIIENGFPPGVFMIDAGWSDYFGHLDFHAGRFPDPRAMTRQLKEWGFRIMLWISPFVSADSREYRRWRNLPGWLLRERDGTAARLEWWDGYSVHMDLTDPQAFAWYQGELERLQRDYGIDGFKFDGGDSAHFKNRPSSWLDAAPVDLMESWVRLALKFPYHELRAGWKNAGQPLVQRLHDRSPSWESRGLGSLIPNAIAMGLLGHPFVIPDMVGGGDYLYFHDPSYRVDEELFVRWTQASALFPMIQFSGAPWRILSPENCALCRAALTQRAALADLFRREFESSARTGEPILRSLEFEFPNRGYAAVKDQFLIGSTLLVAPALEPGQAQRTVRIPPGTWQDERGGVVAGPCELTVDVPLVRIPHWIKK